MGCLYAFKLSSSLTALLQKTSVTTNIKENMGNCSFMSLSQELAVFCRGAHTTMCLLVTAGYYITQKPTLRKVWSERRCWQEQALAGSFPVQTLHNREPSCICYLSLTDQYHVTLVPWYVACFG